jgi:hypothetical protein
VHARSAKEAPLFSCMHVIHRITATRFLAGAGRSAPILHTCVAESMQESDVAV